MRLKELRATYRAVAGAPAGPRPTIRNGGDAAKLIASLLDGLPVERFCVLSLDTKHKPIAFDVLSIGTLDGTVVHPRDIFRTVIMQNAAAFIITHNHPSGDPTPSPDDIALTQRVSAASVVMGIDLIDHVIIGEAGAYVSFKQRGDL
jgi:DNA repair protein RadC